MSIKAKPILARLIIAKKITARLIKTFSKICRYFTTFDGSTSYAALTDEIVLSGDFEIEIKIGDADYSAGFNTRLVLGNLSNSQPSITFTESNSSLRIRNTSGFAVNYIVSDLNYFKNGILRVVMSGSSVEAFFNDVSLGIKSLSTGFILNSIATYTGTQFRFNGQLSDLKIWSNGDRNTGDLILDLPMSEGLKDVYDEVFYRNRVQAQAEWLLNINSNSQIEFQDIALTGDFEMEVEYKSLSSGNSILNFTDGTAVYYQSSSNVSFRVRDASELFVFGGNAALGIGVDSKIVFKLDNGIFRCSVNGVFGSSANMTTTKKDTYYLSHVSGGNPFNNANQISNLKIWQGGDRTTGTLIINSALDDNSNIIANAASPVNANVWTGTVTATGESSGDINSVNVLSTAGASSQVSVPASVAGDDVLIELTLSSGSLDNIIAGDSSTEFTGWQNIRDNDGQPTNRYKTLMNNNDNEIVFKVSGIADATFTNIAARVIEGYGVLQGTRNADYDWQNETPHAIGYNVETNEVCTTDGTTWIDADLWNDSDAWSD